MTGPLSGFTIGVTADRRADDQIAMFESRGAECVHAPTIRTHPLGSEDELRSATEGFLAEPPDVVVLTTGIGVRGWLEAADAVSLGEELREMLRSLHVVARGPKARGAAITADVEVAWNAPSATSDEIVSYLSDNGLTSSRVAVQLDGGAGAVIQQAVSAAGGTLVGIPVYRWSLPEDVATARRLATAVARRKVDAITFTARPAVENFCEIASDAGLLDDVVDACASGDVVVCCVGPVCAAGATDNDLGEPLQPERARLGPMVQALTAHLAKQERSVQLAGISVRLNGNMIAVDGAEPARLTDRERQLLECLLERPGVVLSKRSLLQSLWGPETTDEHVVEVTVGRLRQRLGPAADGVETVVRRGYRASSS